MSAKDNVFILVDKPVSESVVLSTPINTPVIETQLHVVVENTDIHVVAVGPLWVQNAAGGGGGGVFITDIIPTGAGIVATRAYKPNTVPSTANLASCASDTEFVRVLIGISGDATAYSPTVNINGVPAILTESGTKRWFTGYADIQLNAGANTIMAIANNAAEDTAVVTLAGAGPDVLAVTFGAYPGAQTELKFGDSILATIVSTPDAVQFQVEFSGASGSTDDHVATGSVVAGVTISSLTGAQSIRVRARNVLGTYGAWFTSASLQLNQTHPTISTMTVAYPATQSAIKTGESAAVTASVTNYDAVSYSGTGLAVSLPTTYGATKTVDYVAGSYVNSGTNYTITATKASNAATTTASTLVAIADSAPTAAVSVLGNPTRLVGSPVGITYSVRITPTQILNAAPSMNASAGTWSGSWAWSGTYWARNLVISDATTKGVAVFSGLSMTGLANVAGSTITTGSAYTVGGFSMRTLTFAAYARTTAIGTSVTDQTKTTAQYSGADVLTRHTDNGAYLKGYYIANSDGTYNATGGYLGISDTAFASANTGGTLTIDMQETA